MNTDRRDQKAGRGGDPLADLSLPDGWERFSGKVRDALWGANVGVLVTSDRISAYDVVLGDIPGKGAILNQLSLFWFENTQDIIANHILQPLGPRSVAVKRCEVLPVEVIVRRYLTGSAWRSYRDGDDGGAGLALASGLSEYHRFETPVITPSTKADLGDHDRPISRDEVLALGVVSESIWCQVEEAAAKLFRRAEEIAWEHGLALVDTKYEFGLCEGRLHLVDELHTPDSSRFWYVDDLDAAGTVPEGVSPRQLDKEFLRDFLRREGFTGEGTPPEIPETVRQETVERYRETYQKITGQPFNMDIPDISVEIPHISEFIWNR